MSALARGLRRAGVGNVQRFLRIGRGWSGRSSCNGRNLSTAAIEGRKPEEKGVDKIFLGGACLIGATVTKVYYDYFTELAEERKAAAHGESIAHELEAAKKDVKADLEKEYEDHLKSIEDKYEQELKEAQIKASENEARAKQLEKVLENETAKHASELKSQADMITAKLQEEIQVLKVEASKAKQGEAGKEKLRLVNEITELKRQIESLGLTGSDLEKSYLLKKLAMVMGVFAFENAMMNGEPLEKEVVFLQGGDALIDAAISSLPSEAIKGGSATPVQLQSTFVDSKPKLRELILIPVTGGGAVSHLIARGASNLKVKEDNPEDGGIESVFDQVEGLLKDGKLLEAATVLEQSVEGTEAENLAKEWAKQARLRASIEQVHGVLRAHAASISMSLA